MSDSSVVTWLSTVDTPSTKEFKSKKRKRKRKQNGALTTRNSNIMSAPPKTPNKRVRTNRNVVGGRATVKAAAAQLDGIHEDNTEEPTPRASQQSMVDNVVECFTQPADGPSSRSPSRSQSRSGISRSSSPVKKVTQMALNPQPLEYIQFRDSQRPVPSDVQANFSNITRFSQGIGVLSLQMKVW